jgi:hypothetical protein
MYLLKLSNNHWYLIHYFLEKFTSLIEVLINYIDMTNSSVHMNFPDNWYTSETQPIDPFVLEGLPLSTILYKWR